MPHRQIRQISLIDVHKNTLAVKLRERQIPANNYRTFEEINVRDPLEILCQTFVHIRHPGTG